MSEPTYTVEQCRHCPAQIVWALTKNAKWMPVDAEPAQGGNVALTAGAGDAPRADVLGVAKQFGRTNLRMSHFVTCPKAAELRRRGKH